MLAEITGIEQGSISVNLEMIPRSGESVKILYGPDAQLEGQVIAVNHYINQHADEHKVMIQIRPSNYLTTV